MKYFVKVLGVCLCLMVVVSSVAFAKTVTETSPYDYEPVDSSSHRVYAEVWEYPLVDGVPSSGHPLGDVEYIEKHSFVDGECVDCGYERKHHSTGGSDVIPSGISVVSEAIAEKVEEAVEDTVQNKPVLEFVNTYEVKLTSGMSFKECIVSVLKAVPDNITVEFPGVEDSSVESLYDLVDKDVEDELFDEWLAEFKPEKVNQVDCRIVTVSYYDDKGSVITERYAFDLADNTFVCLF